MIRGIVPNIFACFTKALLSTFLQQYEHAKLPLGNPFWGLVFAISDTVLGSNRDFSWKGHLSGFWLLVQLWDLATTISTVTCVRLARLIIWWLPRQAEQPLHGGWRWTWEKCHCTWNVIKAMQHNKNLVSFGQTGCHLQLCGFSFLHCKISDYGCLSLCQTYNSCARLPRSALTWAH